MSKWQIEKSYKLKLDNDAYYVLLMLYVIFIVSAERVTDRDTKHLLQLWSCRMKKSFICTELPIFYIYKFKLQSPGSWEEN